MKANSVPLLSNEFNGSTIRIALNLNPRDLGIRTQSQQLREPIINDKDSNETITDSEDDQEGELQPRRLPSKLSPKIPTTQTSTTQGKRKTSKVLQDRGRWKDEEHKLFLEGLMLYGNEWKMVEDHIGTRTSTQARSHAQKFFIKIKKQIHQGENKEAIKFKIQEIFQKAMGENFKPANLTEFLERVYNLVITSTLIMRKEPISSCIQTDFNCNDYNSIYGSKHVCSIDNNYGGDSSEKDNSESYTYEQNISRKKENVFDIQKDNSRRSSINNNMIDTSYQTTLENNRHHGSKNNNNQSEESGKKSDANLNSYNISKSAYDNINNGSMQMAMNSTKSRCINYYNVTLVDNSTNNIVNNYQEKTRMAKPLQMQQPLQQQVPQPQPQPQPHPQLQPQQQSQQHHLQPQKMPLKNKHQNHQLFQPISIFSSKETTPYKKEIKSNPFNLSFEPIIDQTYQPHNDNFDFDLQNDDYFDLNNQSFHSLNFE